MYLRHTTRRKDGKVHTYWQLVRSVRVGRKVQQQTVAQLGELDAQGRARAKALARSITGDVEQAELFAPAPDPGEPIAVRLDRVRLERGRTFGDVWLGWTLWRALQMDALLERLLPAGREDVPWATMAAVLVLARLCEPSSELHIAEDWYRRTALEDLLACRRRWSTMIAATAPWIACCPTKQRWSNIWCDASVSSSPWTTICSSTT